MVQTPFLVGSSEAAISRAGRRAAQYRCISPVSTYAYWCDWCHREHSQRLGIIFLFLCPKWLFLETPRGSVWENGTLSEGLGMGDEGQPPDFETLPPPEKILRGEHTRDDFFDAVLALHSPATTVEVAELAGHSVDAAREYLEWFERMGIVTQVTDSPATYQRNQDYLNWRRVHRLRTQYPPHDLLTFLEEQAARAGGYAEEFGVESPDEIAITAYAAETGTSIEDVWERVSAWHTTRRRITLLERALRNRSDPRPRVERTFF